jgi:hypothetical protein
MVGSGSRHRLRNSSSFRNAPDSNSPSICRDARRAGMWSRAMWCGQFGRSSPADALRKAPGVQNFQARKTDHPAGSTSATCSATAGPVPSARLEHRHKAEHHNHKHHAKGQDRQMLSLHGVPPLGSQLGPERGFLAARRREEQQQLQQRRQASSSGGKQVP